jgi:tRNA (pseudouridine54-N1)-methyltransferase
MRTFVIIGQQASASADFSLVDLAGSSGRLDVLLRCLRSALLVSHGLRRDTVVYLVLLGGASAPRSVRVEGASAQFVRPDERSLALLVQKALAAPVAGASFTTVRPGVAVANDGLAAVLADLGERSFYLLEERAADLRDIALDLADPVFFLGDHHGLSAASAGCLATFDATPICVGPVSVHADDAVTLVVNELDRREARHGS